ncbi:MULTISPECIES: sugar ABC transporter permease [Thermus]|jgi:arabinogalactan oligomer/maltooligosaccharide transport system permease protein|uniref:Maltose ABC transporter, permease protein n=2 Tax=Thermus thermophilus TaxID=274 RepID=Q5SHT0_THET8|nr:MULTISPECIES: sugar ABC transporter permease [Thermus]QZY58228.1 sugar ABC transporter permease [Thermus thermophilus]BAD71473.1 maltose ABC transporter, permease protein [Thermus thermophilus HB8]BCP66828.1 maltose ABC transporter permease [Thermus thermophilus]BDA38267.1 maltose ABC transporter permease [Thermus thermophilus]BDE45992.1 maltose ABC transporter permease [Thermus thermophilus]
MRKLVAFLLTGLALYGAYWFAANRLFDEGSYRKQVAFGSVFVPYGWAYALGFLGALVLLVLLYSLLYTALVNRLQGRRKSPWPLFLQGVTHLFLWVLILLVYYPVVQVVAASFDPTNNLFSFRRPDTGFLLVDAKVIPYLPNPSLENYAKLVEGVVLYPYQVALALLAGLALLGVGIVGLLRRLLAPEAWMDFWQGRLLFLMALLVFALALSLSPRQFTGQGTETKFLLWVRNTFLISGLTGLLAVLLTATAGYAFARFRHLPGRYPMLLFFIFVQMFPGFLALVAIYYLLSWLDLLNTFTGLVLAYSGGIISFGTWVYKGYLESISPSLEEAAMVDGATRWQVFTKILLPLSAPMFVFIFLLQFVGTYSEFVLANLVLTGVESWNVGVGLRSFTTGQFQTKWGVFAAASVLGSLPILFLFYGFQQYFVSGYTAGAVKE